MIRPVNRDAVTRPGAFFGRITSEVRERAAALLDAYAPGRTLDVGCGNGLFFAALGPSAQVYHGLDADRELLAEAEGVLSDNKVAAHLVRGDVFSLPYASGSFDNVFFLNTLVNIPLDAQALRILRELSRVCRPRGRLVFDIRNARNPVLRFRYWRHNRREDFTTRGHSRRRILRDLRRVGFDHVAVHAIGPRIPAAAFGFVFEAIRNDRFLIEAPPGP